MKKTQPNLQQEIVFYFKKLPTIKQMEVLDFVKWLWNKPESKEGYTTEEIKKINKLAGKKNGKDFKNWESAKKYLKGLMS